MGRTGTSLVTLDQILPQLETWALDTHGADARIHGARFLGGHSGVTVGFDVRLDGREVERLVLKMPPAGVGSKSNFDVLRQVPLLKVLNAHGVLAPSVPWQSSDERFFGGPFLMMTRMPGTSPPDLFGPSPEGIPDSAPAFDDAIESLVKIHAIDALFELKGWSEPRLVDDEVEHWVSVFHKSSNPDWIAQGMGLRDLLHRTAPSDCATGLVHGDYYSNNWLFEKGRLSGIVDWEGSSLGPVLLDLGWLCMIYDRESWGPIRRATMNWHPGPEHFIKTYAQHSSLDLADLPFYRALAGYRLASLTAYYYELHRSGKRRNPAWEVFADSFVFMVDRAVNLLGERAFSGALHG
jgi:aminoglycoside phosphotransferase (APT) family kinase protein